MNTSDSFQALRRANPRARDDDAQSVETAADALHARIATATAADVAVDAGAPRPRRRRRLVRVSAVGVSLAVVAAMVAVLTLGSPGVGPGVANAATAVRTAAAVTAAAAEQSGTAVVRITHDGELWAGTTVRWHDRDVSITRDAPLRRGTAGDELRVVDGVLYLQEPEDGGWVMAGSPASIDPDSGTTPGEYLAAVGEDTGGATLRRLIDGMTGLTERQLGDGATVYSGSVAAGEVARESGFKEGQAIRVFPFGFVAHDEAADPAAPLDAAVTVGADGVIRELAVRWGTDASAWTYMVAYSRLGETPAPVAPKNARDLLRDRLRAGRPQAGSGGSN
jgi:hypothetical protein